MHVAWLNITHLLYLQLEDLWRPTRRHEVNLDLQLTSENIYISQTMQQTVDALPRLELDWYWNIASLDNHGGILSVVIGEREGGTVIL